MTYPPATRADHERFCSVEGWTQVRSARGKAGTHHSTYEFALVDGRILRTRISRPPDRTTYGPRLWAHILRDQLDVNAATFWACVRDGLVPTRHTAHAAGDGLPAEIVYQLVTRWRVAESEVAAMTKQEAVDRLHRLRSEHRQPGS